MSPSAVSTSFHTKKTEPLSLVCSPKIRGGNIADFTQGDHFYLLGIGGSQLEGVACDLLVLRTVIDVHTGNIHILITRIPSAALTIPPPQQAFEAGEHA
jgi:hypothetical protein